MPGGFKFVGSVNDGPDGKLKRYDIDAAHATRLSIGDVVRVTGTSTALTGVAQVDAGAATQQVTGVISGIIPNFATENLTDTGLPAGTAGSVLVRVNPQDLYEVDVVNGPLLAADVGLNVDLVATAATLSGGLTISNMAVNATGKAVTATLPFQVVMLLPDAAGVLGNRARVKINASTNNPGAAGV